MLLFASINNFWNINHTNHLNHVFLANEISENYNELLFAPQFEISWLNRILVGN